MIRRRGHYILESKSKLDRNSSAHCLKCGETVCTPHGGVVAMFDRPCRGTWKKEAATINRLFDQAERRQELFLKWIAFDQKRNKKTGINKGARS
jgi:hypothetical protein